MTDRAGFVHTVPQHSAVCTAGLRGEGSSARGFCLIPEGNGMFGKELSWSPLPLPLVWENRFISRVLVEKSVVTRDPRAHALEAAGECFVL